MTTYMISGMSESFDHTLSLTSNFAYYNIFSALLMSALCVSVITLAVILVSIISL